MAIFFCPNSQHLFNERTGTSFHSLEFPPDVVLLAALWRLLYKLSLRDVAEMVVARGLLLSSLNTCGQNAGDKQEPPGGG